MLVLDAEAEHLSLFKDGLTCMFDSFETSPPSTALSRRPLKAALAFTLSALMITGGSSTASDATGRSQTRLGNKHATQSSTITLPSVVVQPGDSLYRIARRHKVTVEALQFANSLTSEKIQAGQRLILLTH